MVATGVTTVKFLVNKGSVGLGGGEREKMGWVLWLGGCEIYRPKEGEEGRGKDRGLFMVGDNVTAMGEWENERAIEEGEDGRVIGDGGDGRVVGKDGRVRGEGEDRGAILGGGGGLTGGGVIDI